MVRKKFLKNHFNSICISYTRPTEYHKVFIKVVSISNFRCKNLHNVIILTKLSTKQVALISVFAALIAAVSRLPGIPIVIGVQAGQIEFTVPLYPIAGILLGPFIGALAVLLGNVIAFLIPKWSVFGLLTIPAGALSALVAGFLTRRNERLGWKAAALMLGILIGIWYVPIPNPQQAYVGLEAPYYPIPLHLSALALILIFRHKIADFTKSSVRRIMTLGIGLATYIGIMTDHMWGNLMFANLFFPYYYDLKGFRNMIRTITGWKWLIGMGGTSQNTIVNNYSGIGDYFMVMLPISAVERLIFTAIAIVIGVAVLRIIGPYLITWGVSSLKNSTENEVRQNN